MRVYRLAEFRKLPEGTLFCKGTPWVFDSIHVKGETWDHDFLLRDLRDIEAHDSGEHFDRLDEMLEHGASYPLADIYGRDGMFEEDALFLVYEKDDLLLLRSAVDAAIALAEGKEG